MVSEKLINGHPNIIFRCVTMTNVRKPLKCKRKGVLSDQEIEDMLAKADTLLNLYFRLRAKAMVGLFRTTGKRNLEVSWLEGDDLKVEGDRLNVTFSVVKKRKKQKVLTQRTKQLNLNDPLAQHVLRYMIWMKNHHPECKYLFPSVRSMFGQTLYFHKDKHLSTRQIRRIVEKLNPSAWPHLFRETQGAEIVKKDSSLIGVFKVQMRLDLDDQESAWKYMRRYATDVIEYEEKQKKEVGPRE